MRFFRSLLFFSRAFTFCHITHVHLERKRANAYSLRYIQFISYHFCAFWCNKFISMWRKWKKNQFYFMCFYVVGLFLFILSLSISLPCRMYESVCVCIVSVTEWYLKYLLLMQPFSQPFPLFFSLCHKKVCCLIAEKSICKRKVCTQLRRIKSFRKKIKSIINSTERSA